MENCIERIRNSDMVKKQNETISKEVDHLSRGAIESE